MFETLRYEVTAPVARLTLNRPERLNAISQGMVDELNRALDLFEADDSARALVVCGAGRAFSAGFDLKEGGAKPKVGVGDWRPVLERDFKVIMRFWHCPKPTIAAVHGYCLGGAFELAAACDLTVASEGALFGEPEVTFGSGIVAMILPWLTGPKQTKEMLLTGADRIPADRALSLGLINRVVPEGTHEAAALEMAKAVGVMDPDAVRITKQAINRSYEARGMREALQAGLDLDVELESLETPDRKEFKRISTTEGLKAALAWRKARFEA